MCHARDANELLEIAGNELRTIIRDDAWLRFRVLFLGAFKNYSTSASLIDSRKSQCTRKRLNLSRTLHK